MHNKGNNYSMDVTGEPNKVPLCGKDWRTAQALSQAHGVQPDVNKINKDIKGVYKLQEEESFAKRNSKLIKALIILSAIFLVGLLVLIALNNAKSRAKEDALKDAKKEGKDITQSDVIKEVTDDITATGSKTADSLFKTGAKTALIIGGIGAVGAGVALGVTAARQKHLGETLEDFMDESLKQTAAGKIELQNQCIEGAKSNYSVLIDGASDIAQAKIDQVIEKIDRGGQTGQMNVAENTFSKHDVEGACEANNPYPCGKKSGNMYDNYDAKNVSSKQSKLNLESLTPSLNLINY
ncbi:MAG: hypothetical protein IJ590_00690 [Rickettsiales bacterium]|nr:hypothetical protein [Rickettsiales bacterium]